MASAYIGKVIDNYRILSELGVGGMGVVFKAIHTGLDKIVALKMIAPGMAMNANFIRRFQTEAKALARLEDPNIVQIFDFRSDSDQWFIVMEYVDGGNLSDIIRKNGATHIDQSIHIIKQVLSAIGHAHKAGIIHRDIKPNNVMLTVNNVVKITDFGLAKDQGNIANSITVAGGGTLYYMSPEHVKGFSFTDHRSDIYSIGMTFYEMVSGNVPFKNLDSDFDIREMIVRKEIISPKIFKDDIPEILEAIIMKSIAKSPDDRYQSCDEMITDLERYEGGIEQGFPVVNINAKKVVEVETIKKSKKQWLWAAIIPLLIILYFVIQTDSDGKNLISDQAANLSGLEIRTNPLQALVMLNGDTLDNTARGNLQLSAGQYRIQTKMPGFIDRDTVVSLDSGDHKSVLISLNSMVVEKDELLAEKRNPLAGKIAEQSLVSTEVLTSTMDISSNPAGADVWINDQKSGTTPLKLEQLQPGRHKLRISKSGFEDFNETIELSSGNNKTLKAELLIAGGAVEIYTEPAGAIVRIDGEILGTGKAPLLGEKIPVGDHQLQINLDGFEPIDEKIYINSGESNKFNYTLIAQSGNLIVRVRPWGSIYINNQLKKATTDFKYTIELPAVKHRLKVSHPTLGFWEREINIDPNSDLIIDINFNKLISVVVAAYDLDGNSVQADIMLNSKTIGKLTPCEISVRTGSYRLSVVKDGYIAVEGEKKVLIDESLIETQKFILQKIE